MMPSNISQSGWFEWCPSGNLRFKREIRLATLVFDLFSRFIPLEMPLTGNLPALFIEIVMDSAPSARWCLFINRIYFRNKRAFFHFLNYLLVLLLLLGSFVDFALFQEPLIDVCFLINFLRNLLGALAKSGSVREALSHILLLLEGA